MSTTHDTPKQMVTDIFVKGAIRGWNIATHSTIPNVLMAFVLIRVLTISGAMKAIGMVFAPVMGIFGLPGEAVTILLGAWMSMGGGGGVAVGLFDSGIVNGTQLSIVIPAIYLMGSQIQYMGRLLGVVGVSGAMMLKIMALPPIVAITSLFVMRILVLGS